MFEKITPESAGISSDAVTKLITLMEKSGCATHGIIMMRGGKVFAENYWTPFHQDFCHRLYSQTKSFVSVAIGLLVEEGKVDINEKIITYFPEKLPPVLMRFQDTLTVRDMLTMCTAGSPDWWFCSDEVDRTRLYFTTQNIPHRSGTYWEYDSSGSQVLSSLVEKLANKSLFDYLNEKLFRHMGTFKTATILKTKSDDSWGDSAMVCTLRDVASFGQLVMNYGVYDGKRLMGEEYLREATNNQVSNREDGHFHFLHQGYGYQIWRVQNNGFAFVGMGDQLTLCYPDKDLLFAFVSDNQGNDFLRPYIVSAFNELIVEKISDTPLPENKSAVTRYNRATKNLKLRAVTGIENDTLKNKINGVTYACENNPMGISKFTFTFNGKKGVFTYHNAQGKKKISFGINHNVFGKFPQLGYSNEHGGVQTSDGFKYDDAVSLAFTDERTLVLFVQIIDRYFGNMSAVFSFNDDYVSARFSKTAEFFLDEYSGRLVGKKQ